METQSTFHITDTGRAMTDGEQLSQGLGWFSIGLGLSELVAPRAVARLVGADPSMRTRMTLRSAGVREIAAGIGILLRPRRSLPLWARVAGDIVDLGLLAWAATSK